MDPPGPAALVVLAALVALFVFFAARELESWLETRRRRARALRALSAEASSEALLEDAGYTVLGRQVAGSITVLVDGDASQFGLRADLIVGDGERNYVAEVKSGERAPCIGHAATRRQLLEYSIAFDVDGVLLVDAETGEISEIAFESPRRHRDGGSLGLQSREVRGGKTLVDEERAGRLRD